MTLIIAYSNILRFHWTEEVILAEERTTEEEKLHIMEGIEIHTLRIRQTILSRNNIRYCYCYAFYSEKEGGS